MKEINIYYYGYKITNKINNHFYYGIHMTHNLDDGYMGSGIRLNNAYKKYGKENFIKEIIKYFDNENDMILWEHQIVTKELVKDPNCYNSQIGGKYVQSLDMIPVIDENGNIIKVFKDDPKYLSGEYKYMFKGKTIVKDELGNVFAIDCYKIPNNCHGIRYKKVTVKDKNDNKYTVDIDDERYKNGELEYINKGNVIIKDNEKYKSISKEEFKSGNYDFMFKNTIIVNVDGEHKRISLDDERYKNGEIKSIYHNTSMYKDKNGKVFRCNINDPRVLSGELVGVTKGKKLSEEHNKKIHEKQIGRVHINNGIKMKYIYKENLNEYLNNGWILGELPKIYSEEKKKEISKKISEKIKGKIYIHKDKQNKMINISELDNYIKDGWVKGQYKTRVNKISTLGTKWMNNDIINKNVPNDDVENYLKNGWILGMKRKNK